MGRAVELIDHSFHKDLMHLNHVVPRYRVEARHQAPREGTHPIQSGFSLAFGRKKWRQKVIMNVYLYACVNTAIVLSVI
jgi:hypothetical protein